MKKHIILFLVLAPFFNVFAQPGDVHNCFRYGEYKNVQDSIKKYPNETFYKWVRLEILFKPWFQLQTKPTAQVKDYFKYFDFYREYDYEFNWMNTVPCKNYRGVANPTREMGDFLIQNQTQLMNDLDLLIEQAIKVKERWSFGRIYSGNKAAYLFKRGQLYYLNGKPDKAKDDYLSALENEPVNDLKKEILISIAAYYYTLDSVTEDCQRQTLKYLDLYTEIAGFNPHYETEKINLLKSLNDSTTLVNYFHDNAAGHWRNYHNQLVNQNSEAGKQMMEAIRYEQLLFEYLKELNPEFSMEEFKRHKDIITEKIH